MITVNVCTTLMRMARQKKDSKESEDFINSLDVSEGAKFLIFTFNARIYAWYNTKDRSLEFKLEIKKFFQNIYRMAINCGYQAELKNLEESYAFENLALITFYCIIYLSDYGYLDSYIDIGLNFV